MRRLSRVYNLSLGPKKYKIYFIKRQNIMSNDDLVMSLLEWRNLDSWSLEEAAYLSCDMLPPQKNTSIPRSRTQKKTSITNSKLVYSQSLKLKKIQNLILRAKNINKLQDPISPEHFVKWLRSKGIPAHISSTNNINKASSFKAIEADDSSESLTPKESSAETRKVNTVYKIIIALAIKYTGYDHGQKANSLKKIETIMQDYGLEITRSTLSDHLSKAWENNSGSINDQLKLNRKETKSKTR